jgi:hypothetical protein
MLRMTSDNRIDLKKQSIATQEFLNLILTVIRNHNYLPTENSPIALDKAKKYHFQPDWSGELYEQSDVQAQMSMLAAIQDLSLATEDIGHRPAAFLILLRGSIEAAASANFLTSASIATVAERARRGLNEMLYGAFQQWLALDQYGESADAANKLAQINKWLATAAQYQDLGSLSREHERARNPSAPHAGDKRPTLSRMIDDLFPTEDGRRFGRWLYSALSAPAHNSAHGFAIAGAQRLLPDGAQTVDQEAELSHDRVARFSVTGVSAIDTAVKSLFTRYGWPLEDIEKESQKVYLAWLSLIDQ